MHPLKRNSKEPHVTAVEDDGLVRGGGISRRRVPEPQIETYPLLDHVLAYLHSYDRIQLTNQAQEEISKSNEK